MKPAFHPYEGSEPYIFAWYSPEDAETVVPILDALNRAGYRVWYYRVQAGHRRENIVAEHIIHCSVFLLFLSRSSVNSENLDDCYIESSYARHKKRIVIPVYLDAVELPPGLEMGLHVVQHMRFSDYSGSDHFALALQYEESFTLCKASES